ncbi:MAG: adenylyl-sulfate kinase [Bryobacterales bacterium]|nr:adenylyl-sulfate kinase [Bryobacterales bacterium]
MNCYRIAKLAGDLQTGCVLLAESGGKTHCIEILDRSTAVSLHPLACGITVALVDPATSENAGEARIVEAIACPARPAHGLVVWFTGLSGAGKSTLCEAVASKLKESSVHARVLDGDAVRRTVCKGLGYSKEDRDENVRRIGFLAASCMHRGEVALVAAISPYRAIREEVRRRAGRFVEVWVNAPLAICEQRDTKGLYAAARAGRVVNFTGIDDPYEAPVAPEVECRTDVESPEECAAAVLRAMDGMLVRGAS